MFEGKGKSGKVRVNSAWVGVDKSLKIRVKGG